MSAIIKVACLQMSAGPDIENNLFALETMIRDAANHGAKLIASPENTCHIRGKSADKLQSAKPQEAHPVVLRCAELAQELEVWVLLGSVSILLENNKLANRSLLFSPQGHIVASYDKIHLFDVDLPNGDKYRESDHFNGGDELAMAAVDGAMLGLTICYDVRFSYLYRALAQKGANIIAAPAAFTVPTGEAHWEVLLRARAIETGSFIIAPAQTGEHEGGRKTWGHSMIIDPWGKILAEAGSEVGIIYADIDLAAVNKARCSIPALKHDRELKD